MSRRAVQAWSKVATKSGRLVYDPSIDQGKCWNRIVPFLEKAGNPKGFAFKIEENPFRLLPVLGDESEGLIGGDQSRELEGGASRVLFDLGDDLVGFSGRAQEGDEALTRCFEIGRYSGAVANYPCRCGTYSKQAGGKTLRGVLCILEGTSDALAGFFDGFAGFVASARDDLEYSIAHREGSRAAVPL
jgi:hypothetical protein